jgi:hypothetical protein
MAEHRGSRKVGEELIRRGIRREDLRTKHGSRTGFSFTLDKKGYSVEVDAEFDDLDEDLDWKKIINSLWQELLEKRHVIVTPSGIQIHQGVIH